MPTIQVERRRQSYGRRNGSRLYSVQGTLEAAVAISAVLGGMTPMAPAQWGNLSLIDYDAKETAYQLWDIEAIYGQTDVEALQGVVQVSVDTTGASVTQKFAKSAGAQFALAGVGTVDLKRAINVNQDGTVSGVDRPVPRQSIEMRTRLTNGQVTDAYIATLFQATGRINVADWRGYKAQELLFLGARLAQANASEWDASFLFQAEYEESGITIGGITGINKKGWQYLWEYIGQAVQTVKGVSTVLPEALIVRCEDIYETFNFNSLGIPGATGNTSGFFPIIAGLPGF